MASPASAADGDAGSTAVVAPATAALTGDLVVDGTVSVELDAWTPADATVTYAWWTSPTAYVAPIDGVDQNPDARQVEDADASELVLGADLAGAYVWAVATGAYDGLASASVVVGGNVAVAQAHFTGLSTASIAGAAKVGATLTATLSSPATEGTTLSYQWRRDSTPIDGAQTATFAPTSDDLGHSIDVVVGFAKPGYVSAEATSAAVVIGAGTLPAAGSPTIAGTVRVDSAVSARPGTWSEGTTFAYRWRLTDTKGRTTYISGAAAATFTPTAAMRGLRISLVVTGTRPGYSAVTKVSGLYTVGYGAFRAAPAPKISGGAFIGSKLTVVRGTWSPSASYSYQWKRNGKSIKGATKSTYKVTSSDRGKKITVTVTARRSAYTTTSRTSAATASVSRPFTKTYNPTISGTARAGSTLKATVKRWSPTASFSYQWKRNGVAIAGATRSTYTLTTTDAGYSITVSVTGRKSGYYTTTRTSGSTARIGAPVITTRDGLYQVGKQIAAGTYVATGGAGCWFERRSNSDAGQLDGALGWSFNWDYGFAGQKVVTIGSGDKYFYTEGCGRWSLLTTAMRTSVGDGTYVIGRHMATGFWVPSDYVECYVEGLRSFSGVEDTDVIWGGYMDDGFGIRLTSSDKGFTTSGCGTWKRVGN